MLDQLNLSKVLFLDIETVPQTYNYNDLDDSTKYLWEKKNAYHLKDGASPEDVYERAGILAEFGKIVCVSVGFATSEGGFQLIRTKSYFGEDEKILLEEFCELLNNHYTFPDQLLCAHNGKEFDFPYICRRLLINGMKIPRILNIAGKKPWEIKHIDTMELWKFGDYKNYTSLELLTHVFGIPTPKDDIDGSQVASVFYEDKDVERIAKYCEKDVVATIQLLLRYLGDPLVIEENITHA
ncbi:MAG: putative PolB exonuclease-like 3'-5' exonuclease [Parvicellaceae bacterium]|jgi:predicted PolB exonuclease-like 3'-5' exonuclease